MKVNVHSSHIKFIGRKCFSVTFNRHQAQERINKPIVIFAWKNPLKAFSIAAKQVKAGAKGINCQKITEAEVFADAGFEDLLITFNILGIEKLERLAALNARLQQQPDDLRGWVLLARTHASMSNYQQSAQALQKALALTPGHPDILADLADMTAMAQGRKLAGEPEQYIAAALQSDPRHEKALALAASAAEQAGDAEKAQVYWQLLSQVQQSSLKDAAPNVAEPENVLTTASVNIPEKALNTMNEGSALFVFMKAQSGPGMPLAVVRVPATALVAGEQSVRIGPGDFLQEGAMNNLPETVYVQARLSIQGMAQTSEGDIESQWLALARNQLESGFKLSIPDGGTR